MKYMKKEGGLGFRDIEKFNDALLAKQAWRILQNPECLLARILHGRYFSKSNILRATRGTQPSYGWQSILHGRDLLKSGLRFTIGDGDLIQTWIDPWLPIHPPRARTTNPTVSFPVKYLFFPNKSGWNESLVRALVHPDDVDYILSTKISAHQNRDYLGWHYTEKGIYTVKSGYLLATHMPDNGLFPTPPHGDLQLKNEIWKSHTAPKLKHFLWRMLSRALPTGEEIVKRRIANDGHCRRCVTALETTVHLFFNCPHVIQIWRATQLPLPGLSDPLVPLEDKLKAVFSFHKHKNMYDSLSHLPFWILWKIWKSRNNLVYQRKSCNWQRELREARHDADEWAAVGLAKINKGNSSPSRRSEHTTRKRWKKPRAGWIKCNYDGSFRNNSTRATVGWIVRDSHGNFKGAGQALGSTVHSALEAECQSIIHAMQHLWVRGFTKVVLEGDNQSLVKILAANSMRFDILNSIHEIKRWEKRFEAIEYVWTPRSTNHLDDQLAKNQRWSFANFTFHSSVPLCISSMYNSDSFD